MAQTSNIRTAIKTYFNSGLQYKQILHLLLVFHGTSISLRQLKRILRFYNLFRRNYHSPLTEVLSYIAKSLRGSKSCMGYRSLWLNMRQKGIFTTQENVRLALNGMDPEGVASRRKQVFKKRIYRNEGPNWAWHLDGYDKLKPFGFSIHACMDGYSRKVLWLDVSHTNKDPKIIASLYLNCVSSIQACPRLVIADRGSENATLAGIQRFLRRSHGENKAGQRSFRYCRSTANQRIESYWSQLRRSCANWWINLFKDLVDTGVLDTSLDYHVNCIRFAFMPVIQKELDEVKELWNNHRIRKVRNTESKPGIPDVLYYTPELSGDVDYAFPVNGVDLQVSQTATRNPEVFGCSKDDLKKIGVVMREKNLPLPTSNENALSLFIGLVQGFEERLT